MSNLEEPQTSISNFAIELLVMVLLNLDTMDLIRAKQVCTVWRHCVAISTPLLRMTHKLPGVCDHGENPHFEALTEASKAVTIPGGDRKGDNLWDTVRAIEDAYIERFDRSPRCTESSRKPEAYVERYGENMADLRASFRGMRFQQRDENGRPQWPAGLREIQCHLCDRWHTKFHFQNLHPLLQFLDNGSTCFRGYGSRLMLNIKLVEDWKMPLASYEHSCSLMVEFGRLLHRALLAIQHVGTAEDLVSRPVTTKLISCGAWAIENATGLTLREVVPPIMLYFRFHLLQWQQWLRDKHDDVYKQQASERVWEKVQKEYKTEYPERGDWRERLDQCGAIARMWESSMTNVDLILSDIPEWEPVIHTGEDWILL